MQLPFDEEQKNNNGASKGEPATLRINSKSIDVNKENRQDIKNMSNQ